MFEYSEEVFDELFLAIEEDQASFKWLMQNGYKELGAFVLGLKGRQDAIAWLNDNNYTLYALIILAVKKEAKPFRELTNLKDKVPACLVGASHNEGNSIKYLKQQNLELLVELGFVINRSIIA